MYSTYLGGSVDENAYAIAVDGAGIASVTGVTAGDADAFVTKIAPGRMAAQSRRRRATEHYLAER